MPTPEHIAGDVADGDHGVSLAAARREGHITVAVNGRAVDDLAGHRPVAVVAGLPEQVGVGNIGDVDAVKLEVGAAAVAFGVAVTFYRCPEFIGLVGADNVTVGRACGTEVGAAFGALGQVDDRSDRFALFLSADSYTSCQQTRCPVGRSRDFQRIAVLLRDGEPTAGGLVFPAVGIGCDDHRDGAAVGVEDYFRARYLDLCRGGILLGTDLGRFRAGRRQAAQHDKAINIFFHVFPILQCYFHTAGICS